MREGTLKEFYFELYGKQGNAEQKYQELREIIETAKQSRKRELKQNDAKGNSWYLSEKTVGMMLYLDNFSGDLAEFEKKINYLVELGITYVHFMPLLKTRDKNNDGGYAVVDYLKIHEKFGDMEQFEKIISKLHKKGIHTCIDFVLNHTAKEHEWALKARKGEKEFQDMYMMYDTDYIPNEFEKTMPEVFPLVAPKNFTYYDEMKKWILTSFYEFQWDLNYKNPEVFNKIAEIMCKLANIGIDIFRLDAIPFMWKEIGTNCRNLPQVHMLVKMLHIILGEVAPSAIMKGEAIVEPKEIVKYFGDEENRECEVLYNASFMVLLWNSLATKDVRLMQRSLNINYQTPKNSVWVNYARCHDDIGWGLEENIIRELGMDPFLHKQFLINFYEGKYKDSFAIGELYEFDEKTMDARNSGTLASLCGLEKALKEKNQYAVELAVKRILLLHGMIIAYTGIPMIYSGDEIGTLNNWEYKQDSEKRQDSRWLHRGKFNWDKAALRKQYGTIEGYLFQNVKKMIATRKESTLFSSDTTVQCFDTWNQSVFGFKNGNGLKVLANFSEFQQAICCESVKGLTEKMELTDLLQGKTINLSENIILGPYEFLWLQ